MFASRKRVHSTPGREVKRQEISSTWGRKTLHTRNIILIGSHSNNTNKLQQSTPWAPALASCHSKFQEQGLWAWSDRDGQAGSWGMGKSVLPCSESRYPRATGSDGGEKPSEIIESSLWPNTSVSYTLALSATAVLSLNIPKDGDSISSLGSAFQCLTTLSVKKFFIMSNLNLPWCILYMLCSGYELLLVWSFFRTLRAVCDMGEHSCGAGDRDHRQEHPCTASRSSSAAAAQAPNGQSSRGTRWRIARFRKCE